MQRYSLNLLPQESQTRIGNERLARFFAVFHSITALILITGVILLLPTYFFLFFQNKGLSEQVAAAEQTIKSEQAKKTEALVLAANARLRRLEQSRTLEPKMLTNYFRTITERVPDTFSLRSFTYGKEPGLITLKGTARHRDDLLEFIDFLRSHPAFTNVESPVDNILKEENITFTISLTVAEHIQKAP